MQCQRCGQGVILEVRLNTLNEIAYLCDECEALWLRRDQIGPSGFVDLSTYLESRGRTLAASEITVLKEIEDDPASVRPDPRSDSR